MVRKIGSPIILGILIRFILVIGLFPVIHKDFFLPFVSYSLNNPSLDIWQSWLDSGGRQDAFPYGFAMLIPIATFVMISELLAPVNLSISSISLGSLLVIYELAVLKLLSKRNISLMACYFRPYRPCLMAIIHDVYPVASCHSACVCATVSEQCLGPMCAAAAAAGRPGPTSTGPLCVAGGWVLPQATRRPW